MDPDANLAELRRLSDVIITAIDNDDALDPDDSARLAELAQALDEWLTKGGYLPAAWFYLPDGPRY